jgi:GntR family transcriptional regulator, rspAB operon transcriptional repressor
VTVRAGDDSNAQVGSVFSGRHDRRKVTDWVYEELKGAIVDLRLAPGEPLREATLAEQLGVSKTPIREALTRLEQEGLVETTSFKGAVVSSYSRQDLLEIYELRELLENAAARAAAESMSEPARARLGRIAAESRRLRGGGDRALLAALISEFDDVLFDQVRNSRIRALVENLRAHLTRIGHLTAGIPGRIDASVDEHERIVEAIAAHDPALAEQRMREHIRSVCQDQLRALGEAGAVLDDDA